MATRTADNGTTWFSDKDLAVGVRYITPKGHKVQILPGGGGDGTFIWVVASDKHLVLPAGQELRLLDPSLLLASVSQINTWEQCNRYWHRNKVAGIKTPSTPSTEQGKEIHAEVDDYVSGIKNKGQLGGAAAKAVTRYPLPGTGDREGQPQEGVWLERWFAMSYGGAILRGQIDLLTRGQGVIWAPEAGTMKGKNLPVRLRDLKTSSSHPKSWANATARATEPDQIDNNRQLLAYLLASQRALEPELWAAAPRPLADIGQVVVERAYPHKVISTQPGRIISLDRALEQEERDRPLLEAMRTARDQVGPEDFKQLPGAERSSCERWYGSRCPFYDDCHGAGEGKGLTWDEIFARADVDGRGGEGTRESLDALVASTAPVPPAPPGGAQEDENEDPEDDVGNEDKYRRLQEHYGPKAIVRFNGEFRFLSNYWMAPINYAGFVWPSTEHAYQGMKSRTGEGMEAVRLCRSPGQAKRRGQKVPLRPDWHAFKKTHMRRILKAKFTQHPDLAARLLATGARELVEGNTWNDLYWGVDAKTCRGQNWLGKILMEVRAELRTEQCSAQDTNTTTRPTTGISEEKDMGIINPPDAAPPQGIGHPLEGRIEVSAPNVLAGKPFREIKGDRHGSRWILKLWGDLWKFLRSPLDSAPAQGTVTGIAQADIEVIRSEALHPCLKRWDEEVGVDALAEAVDNNADPFAAIAAAVGDADTDTPSAGSSADTVTLVAELMSVGLTERRSQGLVAGGVTLAKLKAKAVALSDLLSCSGIGEKTAQDIVEQFGLDETAAPGEVEEKPAGGAAPTGATAPTGAAAPSTDNDIWGEAPTTPAKEQTPPSAEPEMKQEAPTESQHEMKEELKPSSAPGPRPPAPRPRPVGYLLMIGARPTQGMPCVPFLELIKPQLDHVAALPHKRDDGTRGPVADPLLIPYVGAAAAFDDLLRQPPPMDGRWILVDRGCPYWAKLSRFFTDRAGEIVIGL